MDLNGGWLVSLRAVKDKANTLVLFPYAGGGANVYKSWIKYLPKDINLIALRLPGREDRFAEPATSDLRHIVEQVHRELLALDLRRYSFFGHSMGAIVAYELAAALHENNKHEGLQHLIVSSHRAPHIARTTKPIYRLSDEGFIAEVRRFGGLPDGIADNDELMELALPILRADFEICDRYACSIDSQVLEAPITVLYGVEDNMVEKNQLAAWQVHTSDYFQLRPYGGGHFFVVDHAEKVCSDISVIISQDAVEHWKTQQ